MTFQQELLSGMEMFSDVVVNSTISALDYIALYVDLDYMLWVRWLLTPLLVTFFILPSVILVFIYLTSFFLYIYRAHRRRHLPRRLVDSLSHGDFWSAGRLLVAMVWDGHARLWHGYEVCKYQS